MNIMGIDPGVSTGIVVVSTARGIIFNKTVVKKNPWDIISSWIPRCLYIILEDVPAAGAPTQMLRYNILRSNLLDTDAKVITILAGEWKPYMKASGIKATTLETVHEQDAYQMITYAKIFKIRGEL